MTGPAGGSSPLDLAALDVMIAAAEHTWGRDHELVATLRTVLALLRETRAALSDAICICMSPQAKWIAVLAKAVEGG